MKNTKEQNTIEIPKDKLTKLVEATFKLNLLELKFKTKFNEKYAVESEIYHQIHDNRNFLNSIRGESEITIIQPEYNLLNCICNKNDKVSSCAIFRSNNIVYLTIVFEGNIEIKEGETRKAEVTLEMPMWKILAGTFKIESLSFCLAKESSLNKLCLKLNQKGNEVRLCINQNELDIQTYWDKSDKAKFTIRANFFIEPTKVRAAGMFYIYNIAFSKAIGNNNNELVLVNDWKKGNLFEIYNEKSEMKIKAKNKYLNNNNGCIKLENNKNTETEIVYMPGFSDIVYIVLYQNDRPTYLSVDESGKKLTLENEPNTKSQFLIIPELK